VTEMVCIVCPRGCVLSVSDGPEWGVTGNGCARGAVYGRSEAEAPVRTVTATCAAIAGPGGFGENPRRVPVKTTAGVPKARVAELARTLLATGVRLPVRAGDTIIEDWEGTGVAVVATRDVG